MGEEIIIDKELLRAIGADTRIAILKSLAEHQKTQSDLAKELNLSPPTILEHLGQLGSAGLVEKMDEGRKWIYYVLTPKGQKLVSAGKKKVPVNAMIILAVAMLFLLAAFFTSPMLLNPSPEPKMLSGGQAFDAGASVPEAAPLAKSAEAPTSFGSEESAPLTDSMESVPSESGSLRETVDIGEAITVTVQNNQTNETNTTIQ